jgi:hypothetical protein
MKLLQRIGSIVSLAFVGVGFFQLYRLGIYGGGVSSLCAASGCAFALCLTLYVFHLRDRIIALEKHQAPE